MHCVKFLLLFIISVNKSEALNVLGLFLHPGVSHQKVFDSVLIELANRGHNVTTVQHFPIKNPPPLLKVLDINGSMSHTGSISLDLYDRSWYAFDGIYDSTHLYHTYIVHNGVAMCDLFLSSQVARDLYHGNESYDLILTEAFNSDCIFVLAEKMNVPVIAMQSHSVSSYVVSRLGQPDNPAYIPQYILVYSDNMSLTERLINAIIHYYQKYSHRYHVQMVEEKIILDKLGVKIESLEEIAKKRTKLLLSNAYHVLNRPRPLVPAIVEIGGVHLKQKEEPIREDIEKFISQSKDGVVIFSFGSLLNASSISTEKLKIFQKIFSEIPQQVIWKYNEEYMPNKPKNVKLIKWLQQQELLQHKNVRAFIGHGGLLGMTEAIHAGVSMLVISVLGDQHANGAIAQESGLGVTLKYKDITEENLRYALKQVLSPEIRASAKRLSRIWKDRPMSPMDTAIFWIEFIGRNPDVQMATKARDLPFYSLALLDIGILFILIIISILLTIYLIIKSVFYMFCNSKHYLNKAKHE